MANGANDSNGQFGGNTSNLPDPTQPQQDKPQKPGLLARTGEKALHGFLGPIVKGAGESITDMLMGPGGRREKYREEKKEDVEQEEQFQEHEKEVGEAHENFLAQISQQANSGLPMSPQQTQSLIQMGFGKDVIGAINAQAQQAQQGFMQMDKDFKSGAYGNPKDPQTQELYSYMKMGLQHPQAAPFLRDFMKNQGAMRIANFKAAASMAQKIYEQAGREKITQEHEAGANARAALHERGANVRETEHQRFETRLQKEKEGFDVAKLSFGEKLHEKLAKFTAGLKGSGPGAAKALGNIDTAVKTVLSGKIGGASVADISDNADAQRTIIDNANVTALESNPNMSIMQAMSNMAFFSPKGSDSDNPDKSYVGKGIDGFVNDLSSKGAIDEDSKNTFLKYYYEHVANNPDQTAAMKSLVSATAFFPPKIRDMILANARRFGSLLNEASPSGDEGSSEDEEAPAEDE